MTDACSLNKRGKHESMGVPKLFAWIRRRYRRFLLRKLAKTIHKRKPDGTDETREIKYHFSGLYVDGNSLLHEANQWVRGYGKYKGKQQGIPDGKSGRKPPTAKMVGERFIFLVEESYTLIKPSKSLYIAIDGPAPLAKGQQQRTRRFYAATKEEEKRGVEDEERNREEVEEGATEPAFDTSLISPGTPFMDEIDTVIRDWLKANVHRLPKDTVYYSHRMAGEGEHKLLNALGRTGRLGGGMAVKAGKL